VCIAAAFALRSLFLSLLVAVRVALAAQQAAPRGDVGRDRAPTFLVLCATWAYQARTFGDWTRGRIPVWLSVPYDYPSLVRLDRLPAANFASLAKRSAVLAASLGAIGTLLLAWKRPPGTRELAEVAVLTVLPMNVFHMCITTPTCASICSRSSSRASPQPLGSPRSFRARLQARSLAWPPQSVALALCLPRKPDPEPRRRVAAEAIFAGTPSDATVVTFLDGVYLAALEPAESRRDYVPISRRVEYAAGSSRRARSPTPIPAEGRLRSACGGPAGGRSARSGPVHCR
jgi:hypothetical protein